MPPMDDAATRTTVPYLFSHLPLMVTATVTTALQSPVYPFGDTLLTQRPARRMPLLFHDIDSYAIVQELEYEPWLIFTEIKD